MSQKPSDPSATIKPFEGMSDKELRETLLLLGEKIGPIVDSTRGVYQKKLTTLQSQGATLGPASASAGTKESSSKAVQTETAATRLIQAARRAVRKPINGDPMVVILVENMTDEKLRGSFKEHGYGDPGPILPTTRILYQRKLIKLMSRQIPVSYSKGALEDYGFSSGDEDMEWT